MSSKKRSFSSTGHLWYPARERRYLWVAHYPWPKVRPKLVPLIPGWGVCVYMASTHYGANIYGKRGWMGRGACGSWEIVLAPLKGHLLLSSLGTSRPGAVAWSKICPNSVGPGLKTFRFFNITSILNAGIYLFWKCCMNRTWPTGRSATYEPSSSSQKLKGSAHTFIYSGLKDHTDTYFHGKTLLFIWLNKNKISCIGIILKSKETPTLF